jgi:cell division protein FtsI (penicillin-binding protein 3)
MNDFVAGCRKGGAAAPIRLDGVRYRALETARNRLLIAGIVFLLAFGAVSGRLVELAAFDPGAREVWSNGEVPVPRRADIVDRNGVLLATSLPSPSLYGDPREIHDPVDTANKLAKVFPNLDRGDLVDRLKRKGHFVWIRRNLTPDEQFAVNRLGLPGLDFQMEARRVYPQGPLTAHVLGYTDVDGRGLAGVEHTFEATLRGGQPLRLSLDVRLQSILRSELLQTIRDFDAIGGAGLILDVTSGEALALASLPDFDPNAVGASEEELRFNRVTQGVYEMGSTFKLLTLAMALDSGTTSLSGGYDASHPIRVARFTIRDYHPKNRWLSVPEILVHSSNIGAAHMALDVGSQLQRKYLDRLGLLAPPAIELPEVETPLAPNPWRDINTMTIGFGHGIAVSPLQLAAAIATVVNGGFYRSPTILHRETPAARAERVLSRETSETMRALMRLVVQRGTGTRAEVAGLRVGGKTGTAEKQVSGRYRRNARLSSFVGAFPMDSPRYLVLVMIDEPKGNKSTYYYATGGWVAAPTVGRVVERISPILGVEPVFAGGNAEDRKGQRQKEKPLVVLVREAIEGVRGSKLAAN